MFIHVLPLWSGIVNDAPKNRFLCLESPWETKGDLTLADANEK